MLSGFDNTTIIVVGGAGFVGSNLVRMLLQEDVEKIVIIDNLLSSEKENIPEDSRIDFRYDTITNDDVLNKIADEYDYIFHLATYHGNQNSIHDPLADHENNTLTTLKLMNHIKEFKNLKKVVYSGAGCASAHKTFGEAEATIEDAPITLDQDSPYSISKLIGEFYSVYFHKQHSLPTVRARFQNVYGPGEVLGAGKWRGTPETVWRNVTPAFIYKALNKQAIPLQNNGIATRDFIFVEDICRGLIACALKGIPGEAYNIASGIETSILNHAEAINELCDNMGNIEHLPKRTWDNSGKRFGSTEKSKKEIGFAASVNYQEGLERTIEWTRNSLPFIKKCIEKHSKYMN